MSFSITDTDKTSWQISEKPVSMNKYKIYLSTLIYLLRIDVEHLSRDAASDGNEPTCIHLASRLPPPPQQQLLQILLLLQPRYNYHNNYNYRPTFLIRRQIYVHRSYQLTKSAAILSMDSCYRRDRSAQSSAVQIKTIFHRTLSLILSVPLL